MQVIASKTDPLWSVFMWQNVDRFSVSECTLPAPRQVTVLLQEVIVWQDSICSLFLMEWLIAHTKVCCLHAVLFIRKFGVWWRHRRLTKIGLKGSECRIGSSSGNCRERPQIMIAATAVRKAETCCVVIDVQRHFICSASESSSLLLRWWLLIIYNTF